MGWTSTCDFTQFLNCPKLPSTTLDSHIIQIILAQNKYSIVFTHYCNVSRDENNSKRIIFIVFLNFAWIFISLDVALFVYLARTRSRTRTSSSTRRRRQSSTANAKVLVQYLPFESHAVVSHLNLHLHLRLHPLRIRIHISFVLVRRLPVLGGGARRDHLEGQVVRRQLPVEPAYAPRNEVTGSTSQRRRTWDSTWLQSLDSLL